MLLSRMLGLGVIASIAAKAVLRLTQVNTLRLA